MKSNPVFSSLDLWALGVMRRPILQGAIERRDADRQTPVRGKKEEVGNDRSAQLDVTRYSTAPSGVTET